MKLGVRQIVRAATGRAESLVVRRWVSVREVVRAYVRRHEGLWNLCCFLDRAKTHGWRGAVFASLLVGTTIALNYLLGLHVKPDDPMSGAAITVLGTVVTFFAVSTLAVSVSLTLLQTSAHMWPARIMDSIFTADPDREFLLQTIYMAFLVSLVNLALLTAGLVHPLLALGWPVLLAFLTLMSMVAYVFERVRLFSSAGLIAEITRRFDHQIKLLGDGPDPQTARLQALARVSDIFEVALALAIGRRLEDADDAIRQGWSLAEELMQAVQTSPRLQALEADFSDQRQRYRQRYQWGRDLSRTIGGVGRRACVQLDDLDGMDDGTGLRYYITWLTSVFSRLSGAALVDFGSVYIYTEKFESSKAVVKEIKALAALANALSSDSTITSPLISQEKESLLSSVARKSYRLLADRRALCAANGEVSPDAVNVLGQTFRNYSPAVLALPLFADFAALLDEWKASLSAEQSSRLTKTGGELIAGRWNRETAA
jgi:hypothetical protein